MKEYIAFDSHKRYTLAERESVETGKTVQTRIDHAPGAITRYLQDCEPGTPVAVEAIGSWYWIIQEIEQAGLRPRRGVPLALDATWRSCTIPVLDEAGTCDRRRPSGGCTDAPITGDIHEDHC